MKLAVLFFLGQYLIFCSKLQLVNSLLGTSVRSANEFEFPFIVFITIAPDRYFNPNDPHFCSGSLITLQDVLCSEHCLRNRELNDIEISAGSYELRKAKTYKPAWWVGYSLWAMHKSLRVEYSGTDLTIIRLTENVTDVMPGIPSSWSKDDLYTKDALIASFGRSNNGRIPNFLEVGPVTIISKKICEKRYHKFTKNRTFIHDAIICSAKTPPYTLVTHGDWGSPLLYQNRIVGVTKGATPPLAPNEVFHPSQLNIHYIISFFKNFIKDVIENCP